MLFRALPPSSWLPLSFDFLRVLPVALPRLVRSDSGFSDVPSSSICGVELLLDAREWLDSDRLSGRRWLWLGLRRSLSDISWLFGRECVPRCCWCRGCTCGYNRQMPDHHFQPPVACACERLCVLTCFRKRARRSFSRSQYSARYSSQFSRNSGEKDLGSRSSLTWSPPVPRSSSTSSPPPPAAFSSSRRRGCSTRCHSLAPARSRRPSGRTKAR